jgi:hypothetical protein
MHYDITQQGTDVEILVRDTAGHARQLLASFQECQQGRCGCPTDQYDRLAALAIEECEDQVAIRLSSHEGERLDVDQLEACLDYMVDNVGDEPTD